MAKVPEKGSLQMMTALAIGLFFIIIGLPLWWKTTTTYRAYLPHGDIHTLANEKLICHIPVSLIPCHQDFSPDQLKLTGAIFEDFLNHDVPVVPGFTIKYSVSSRSCSQRELKHMTTESSFEIWDQALGVVNGVAWTDLQIYLLPESSWTQDQDIYVGKYNTVFGLAEKESVNFRQQLKAIASCLKKTVLNEQSLANAYVTSRGVRLSQVDPGTVRALQSTSGYKLSFSLVNSDPSEVIAEWNIKQAVQDYLQPFLDKLKQFADFSVSSQVLYYSQLPLTPKKVAEKNYFYIPTTSVPLLINPMETKIGSDITVYPTLNFLVFVPLAKHSPLYIHDEKGSIVDTNAFFSPRWGGIQVQNPPTLDENSTRPVEFVVDMKAAMEVYLSQLRLLIGIPQQKSSKDAFLAKPGQEAIREWELQTLLRKRTIENIATATNTLYSLSHLLEKIHNMVIKDDVAEEVYGAVECLHKAHQFLKDGELSKAFHYSKKAIILAEKAFFDPSLLALLYFPQDQKFAIYIPLFLPVGIPVATSLFKAIKWWRRKKEKQS